MTALKQEAIRLAEQMPYVIQYIKRLKDGRFQKAGVSGDKATVTPKMKAFMELEEMLVPVFPELDYDKELAEARDKNKEKPFGV